MLDYYKILGIPRMADHATIRSAYKRLALQYHPDRNPNNQAAEEYFKIVNEAKQLLSDPVKKARYDLLLDYAYESAQKKVTETSYRPYYTNQNIFYSYESAYKFHHAPIYRIDKDYYKVQLLTLTLVAVISIFSIGIFRTSEYLKREKIEKVRAVNEKVLSHAQELYNNGNYRTALNMVINLIHENPIEEKYYHHKESMVATLNSQAILLYQKAHYKKAIENLEILQEYQQPMRVGTWRMIADCYYQLGHFKKALHALEYIRIRDKNNIELIMQIGNIYYNDMHDTFKALDYYTEAKLLFKEFQRDSYGGAFELIMPTEKVPQLYFDMFMKRAELNMEAGNYEEAITDYNWASYLRADSARAYHFRGICKKKTGKTERACNDWQRAANLGYGYSHNLLKQNCQ